MVSRDTGGFGAHGCTRNLEHIDIGNLLHGHTCTVPHDLGNQMPRGFHFKLEFGITRAGRLQR